MFEPRSLSAVPVHGPGPDSGHGTASLSGAKPRPALTIQELPLSERPRERLKSLGPQALSTAELFALLIGSGAGGRNALEVAHEVLAFADGSLRRLTAKPPAALTALTGVGPARAVAIHAALEIGRRLAAETVGEGAPMRNPKDVYAAFRPRLEDLEVEEFHVAVLEAQHRLERGIKV